MSHLTAAVRDEAAQLVAHITAMGGWVTAGYFDRDSGRLAVRDALLGEGLIVAGQRGSIRTYGLTSLGRAWHAENGIG